MNTWSHQHLRVALTLTVATAIAPAAADDTDKAPSPERYVLAGAHYVHSDESRATDYGMGVQLGYGGRLTPQHGWEFRAAGNILETGIPGQTDFYMATFGVDLVEYLGQSNRGRWILLAGAGGAYNDVTPDANDGWSGYLNAGAGWRGRAMRNWGEMRPRVDLRYVHDSFDGGQGDVWLSVSLEFPRTGVRVVEKIVEVEKEVIREVPVEVIREVPVEVVREPVVTDRDGDGIPDNIDKCPDTIAGARVGPDGCIEEEQTIVLPDIEFEFDKATLTPEGRLSLHPVVRFLREQAEVELDIWGHTDDLGTERYNQTLSEARARTVKEYLIEQGIAPLRLTSDGFGELRPIASNATLEGKARNRRVELRIRMTAHSGSDGEVR